MIGSSSSEIHIIVQGRLIYFYDDNRVKEQDFHTDGIFEYPLQREIVNSNVPATPLAWLTFALKLKDSLSSCVIEGQSSSG